MKKFFSAILLMTMMVFSVGTFVSCNDLVNEIEGVKGQATELEAAVDALEAEIATLETKLQAAQSAADDAMAAAKAAQKTGDEAKVLAEAAKAAAADAEAKAIAKAKEEVAALKTELEAAIDKKADKTYVDELVKAANDAITKLQGDVKTLEEKLASYETTLENFKKNLEDLDALTEELEERIDYNLQAITNLQGAVDNHEMKIEDLEAAVAKIEKAMKEMDNNLIKAIAGQIQSIVFVPEYTDGTIKGMGYSWLNDQKKTVETYLISASYDVKPVEAAALVTVETAEFAGVVTKAAGAAETIKPSVVEANPATGRVVVYAAIPSTSETFKAIKASKKTALALCVNSANDVKVDENTTEDLGTYVSSAYTNVDVAAAFTSVYGNYYFVKGDKYDKSYNKLVADNIKVPYNWQNTDAAKAKMFDAEVKFMIEPTVPTFVTPEVASALLEKTLVPSYEAIKVTATTNPVSTNAVDKNNDKKIDSPISFTTYGLDAVGQLVGSADYTGQATNGQTATLTLGTFKLDGQDLKLVGSATYEVVDAKVDAAIVISAISKDWSYLDAKNVWSAGTWAAVERDVTLPSELTSIEPLFNKQSQTFYAKWQSATKDGKPVYSYAAAEIEAKASKAVTVKSIYGVEPETDKNGNITGYKKTGNYPLTYNAEKTTYVFEQTLKNAATETDYTLAFEVVVNPMPANQTFKLNNGQPYELVANTSGAMTVTNVDLMTQALAHAREVDAKVPVINAFDVAKFAQTSSVLTLDGSKDKLNGLSVEFNPDKTKPQGSQTYVEASTIVVSGIKKYDNTITATVKYELYGVVYTYEASFVTKQPTIALNRNDFYVESDGTVNLDNGSVRVTYTTTATSKKTNEGTAYALPSIDLRNYVTVDIPAELVGDYMLKYTLLTPMYKADGKTQLYTDLVNAGDEFKMYTSVDKTVKRGTTTYTKSNPLTWNTDLTSLKFKVELISVTQGTDDKGNPVDVPFAEQIITLSIPELLTLNTEKVVKEQLVAGEDVTANIAEAIKVVDHFGNAVYNPWASNSLQLFDGYYAAVANGVEIDGATLTTDDQKGFFSKLYDQEIVLPTEAQEATMIEVYLDGVKKNLTDVMYDFNNETGLLTLEKENAKITGEVEFRIKVGLIHKYSNYSTAAAPAQTGVISVVFTDKMDEEGTGSSVANISGNQWIIPASAKLWGEEVNYVLDFTDPVNAVLSMDMSAYWDAAMVAQFGGTHMVYSSATYRVVPADAKTGVIVWTTMIGGIAQDPVAFEYKNYVPGKTCEIDLGPLNGDDKANFVTCTIPATPIKAVVL